MINLFERKILSHHPWEAEGLYHPSGVEEDVEGAVQSHLHHHVEEGGVFGTNLQPLQLVVDAI